MTLLTCLKRDFTLQNDTITVKLENDVLMQKILEHKEPLMQFIREKLNNYKIMLEAVVFREENKRMIYTPREKFDYLSDKEPLLKKLKDRLGLDPDF